MKLGRITLIAAFILLPFASAFPADDVGTGGVFSGQVEGTGWWSAVSGSKAKFSEYQDMLHDGGFLGNIRLGYDSDNYFLKIRASDIGYKTQSYSLETGLYGKFKFDAFENSIVHNTTFGARTPYFGIGSNNLTTPITSARLPSNTDPATWNTFDYSTQRNQYGGGVRLDLLDPFYADVHVSREDKMGLLPWSNGNGIEFPAPVNYETTDYTAEIGYKAKPLFAALTYSYSEFTDSKQSVIISGGGPISNSTSSLMSLPPDNHVYKLGFRGTLQLPLNSRFGVSLSNAHQRSTYDLSTIVNFNNAVPGVGQTTLNSTGFIGRKIIQNYAFSLTSNPVRPLDIKLFYKYFSTINKSDTIIQSIVGNTPPVLQIPLFDYKKNIYGATFGLKLPVDFHLNAGYSYIDTNRETRSDIPSTEDNLMFAELKWTGLDFLTPKIGYERLMRLAKYGPPYALDASPSHINFPQFTMLDGAKQRRDIYKAGADFSPLDNLNVGVAYKYRKSEYPDNTLGIQKSSTNELETYGNFLVADIVKVDGYFDFQESRQYLLDYNGSLANLNAGANNASNYFWSVTPRDNTYEYGAGADIYIIPAKLTLRIQYDFVNSDGTQDFSFFFPGVISGVNANSAAGPIGSPNLNDVDSYHLSAIMAKLNYALTKSCTLAAGARFENYKYMDYGLSNPNYQYIVGGSTFLTGAYANPSYNASVVFLSAAYKF